VSKGLCLYGVEVPEEACCFSCMESIMHVSCVQKVARNRGTMDCPRISTKHKVKWNGCPFESNVGSADGL
jgi:hypothetical protein